MPELLELAGRALRPPGPVVCGDRAAQTARRPGSAAPAFRAAGISSSVAAGAKRRGLQDERYLIFDCGPLGDGGHGHYDLLNFESPAGGGRWSSIRAATPTPRRSELAALVQGHGRPQHGDASTGSTRRRTAAAGRRERSRTGACSARISARRASTPRGEARSPSTTPCTPRDRCSSPALLDRRRPPRGRRRIATTCASTWPPGRHGDAYPSDTAAGRGRRGWLWCSPRAPALSLEAGWVAPSYGAKLEAPV